MRTVAALIVTTAVLAAGCGSPPPTAPAVRADDAAPLAPPAWYARAYASMERCSGLHGDFARVRWYHVSGSQVPAPDNGGYAAAVTYPASHTIIIADFYAADTVVVEHEVMHELTDILDHPAHWFDGACGDLMP